MSEAAREPAEGIVNALGDLSEETRRLVRQEIAAAERETTSRLKEAAPGIAMAGLATALGVTSAMSGYRFLLRLLERVMSPSAAALIATIVPGALAGVAGMAAKRALAEAPLPFPGDTLNGVARAASSRPGG